MKEERPMASSEKKRLLDLDQKLDFGKYRGTPLAEVPTDYLLWVRKTVNLSWEGREQVERALRGRGVQLPKPTLISRNLKDI